MILKKSIYTMLKHDLSSFESENEKIQHQSNLLRREALPEATEIKDSFFWIFCEEVRAS